MKNIVKWINNMLTVSIAEFRGVLRDPGVMIVIVGAMIVYPVMYCSIYKKETLYNIPVAIVDDSRTPDSRRLVRSLDASPDIEIAVTATDMEDARHLFESGGVHGIIYIPADFSDRLARREQAFISAYCDMSSFLYYRAMVMAGNYATLDMGHQIQIERMAQAGVTGESAALSAAPIRSEETILFNSEAGFFSFLMPPVLILIIHQTLIFGICMMAGQAREDGRFRKLLPVNSSAWRVVQVVTGKALCYLAFYSVLTAYMLGVIPRLFGLPHLGDPWTLVRFMTPFLIATTFFGLTLSVFMQSRETGLVSLLFFSLILLFLSGFSWPVSNFGGFWRTFAELFPSTGGIRGFIRINSMGASLQQVSAEYSMLWIQAAVYFTTACFAMKPRRTRPIGFSGTPAGSCPSVS